MADNFGPMVKSGLRPDPRLEVNNTLFFGPWRAERADQNGSKITAEYTMFLPTKEKAYFHMLLDASGSTWPRVKTGDKKRLYKHLLNSFETIVLGGDALRPNDVVYVWLFNRKTTLLCEFERKDFKGKMDMIRSRYKSEFIDSDNYKETRLYDAVATVMEKIKETHKTNKKSDYFLVPFTDGVDYKSERTNLNNMMNDIFSVQGRLHTFFITINMPADNELHKRLKSHQGELSYFNCEKAEPNEISRGFNSLRDCIKVILCVSKDKNTIRVADYGYSRCEVAEKMMAAVAQGINSSSLLESFYHVRGIDKK
ncbi:uncharacterized protein [Physcomitrium patens]|uniref:VWFA domain-containing protein n=1 Tax=Physcomitrium patens TaxID=3218 RepID=A0A2K1KHJ9_PHYPA|nr:hypothetical protein PHYPA_009623 [Physcomitrium patens]